MSAPDPGPAPSSSDGVPEQLPGVAGGRTSRRPGPPPRAPHRGDPSVWAPPGPPTAPPPPSRGRRALVATVVTVVVVTLAGLGALGWWATSTARDAATSVPPVGTGWSAPPAGRLLTALDAAALECVVEVADPEQHVCFALAPEDWAEVHWQVGDGRVAGLTATVDHSAGPGSVAARVVAATAVGLDLPDADLSALVRALEQVAAGAEGGEPVLVDTVWGALQLRPAGGGWVDLAGQSHDTPTRPHAGKDLGLGLDAATGLVQQHGYRCGEPEEDTVGGYAYLTCNPVRARSA